MSQLAQPQWVPTEPAAEPARDGDQPKSKSATGKTISEKLGEMSLVELVAFSRGCVIGHRESLALDVIRAAERLMVNAASCDAANIVRELLAAVVTDQCRSYSDHVPF